VFAIAQYQAAKKHGEDGLIQTSTWIKSIHLRGAQNSS